MSYMTPKETYLGWVQLSILTLLWEEEMYGLEIRDHLKLKNYNIGPGQLYPALKRLEEVGWIVAREDNQSERVNRKFYTTSIEGRNQVILHIAQHLFLFAEIFTKRVSFIANHIHELVDMTKQGIIIADLSRTTTHTYKSLQIMVPQIMVPKKNPTAQYFITSTPEWINIIKVRLEHANLDKNVSILLLEENSIPLPDSSVDVIISYFTLHEDNCEWYYKEFKRLLKDNGKIVIVEMKPIEEANIIIEFWAELVPSHTNIGLIRSKLEKELKKNKLKIIKEKQYKGVEYLVIEHL
ncbi:MAG: helix-turn-helix transcriptional regulator [Promethearchaeota archaeon]